MNIQSHVMLASMMKKYVRETYGLELRSDMLHYGSVRPDMTPPGEKKAPHTFEDSISVFLAHSDALVRRSDFVRPPLYVLSFRLGLMLHYAADYFTYAHHDKALFHQTKAHFLYENELMSVLLKTTRKKPDLPNADGKRLDQFLAEAVLQYDSVQENPQWDADHIVGVSQVVCDRIIQRLFVEKEVRPKIWHTAMAFGKVS